MSRHIQSEAPPPSDGKANEEQVFILVSRFQVTFFFDKLSLTSNTPIAAFNWGIWILVTPDCFVKSLVLL